VLAAVFHKEFSMTLKLKNSFALLLICAILAVNVSVMFAQDEATEEATEQEADAEAAPEEGEVLGGIAAEEPTAVVDESETEVETVDEASDEVTAEEGADTVGAEPGTVDVEASAENEAEPETPQGIGTLFLLLGIGAVLVVGGAMIARDSFKADPDADA
jgi:hypothetical protein